MYKNKRVIAIIPARGGSKGLPGKNIKIFAGVPLICHTVEAVKQSSLIDTIIVSTDDKKIARIAKEAGAPVPFLRPKKYAKDSSPSSDVILHAIHWYERKNIQFDIVILLEPTSPLRKIVDVDRAVKKFVDLYDTADALISVGEIHTENPYISKIIDHGFVKPLLEEYSSYYQRQQLPRVYFPFGGIYISKIASYKTSKTFYQKQTIPYIIERWQNYEIDDIYDFYCAEKIMMNKRNDKRKRHKKIQLPVLSGKKVQLKIFLDDQLFDERYFRWLKDKEVMKTIGRNEYMHDVQFSDVMTYVRNLQLSDHDYFFAIQVRKTGEFIGTAKIGSIDWANKTADIGIMIGEKNYWGKGLATETLYLLCEVAFKEMHLRKLTGGCMERNIAMNRCFKKIGFIKEGVRRKQNLLENEYTDHILYGLFKNEFFPK